MRETEEQKHWSFVAFVVDCVERANPIDLRRVRWFANCSYDSDSDRFKQTDVHSILIIINILSLSILAFSTSVVCVCVCVCSSVKRGLLASFIHSFIHS